MIRTISFVIPCYRSAGSLPQVVEEICAVMRTERFLTRYTYEIILVCDGSPDDTFDVIRSLCARHEEITGIDLARNFGQHAAVMAGLRHAKGDCCICLDDDGQTPASQCGRLLDKLEEGYDAVYAAYAHKKHSGVRNALSRLNAWMARGTLGKPKGLRTSSYFAVRRFVVDEMIRYQKAYPYLAGLILRTTKSIANVPVDHERRHTGKSGYTVSALFGLWMNALTSFSIKPLRIATGAGAFLAGAGFFYGLWTIVKHLLVDPSQPAGWSSLMSVLLFTGGMILLMLGLIGEYVGRIYGNINDAPQYVVKSVVKKHE